MWSMMPLGIVIFPSESSEAPCHVLLDGRLATSKIAVRLERVIIRQLSRRAGALAGFVFSERSCVDGGNRGWRDRPMTEFAAIFRYPEGRRVIGGKCGRRPLQASRASTGQSPHLARWIGLAIELPALWAASGQGSVGRRVASLRNR
jgi:hypothetical protein